MAPFYSSGKCRCGAVSIGIDMKPFLTYNCHCSHCRGFSSRCGKHPSSSSSSSTDHQALALSPYHSGGMVWKWNVQFLQGQDHIEYEKSTALWGLFAMSRGRCQTCRQPIWESGERSICSLAMVMATPLLPELKPDTDIFYDSGYQKGPTGTIVIRSDLGSLLYEVYILLFKALPLIPWSIYKRLTR